MSALEPLHPSELISTLERLTQVLNARKTSYALIGGLCVAVRGPVRATRDIDMLVSVPQIELARLLESILEQGFRLDLAAAIRSWNEEHLLDFAFGAVRVDWIKAVLPVFQRILDRARWENIAGQQVRVADAEGLLLLKLIAFRPQDQEDIRGVLAANAGALDLEWVRQGLAGVTVADDPRGERFEQMVTDFYEPRNG